MEEWIDLIIHYLAIGVEVCGMVVIVYGAGRTFYTYLREEVLRRRSCMSVLRLQFAYHLALGLEFALAGDILKTILSPTWEKIGLLAAIAVMRTVLNFFLEHEMEVMEHKEECLQRLENGESG